MKFEVYLQLKVLTKAIQKLFFVKFIFLTTILMAAVSCSGQKRASGEIAKENPSSDDGKGNQPKPPDATPTQTMRYETEARAPQGPAMSLQLILKPIFSPSDLKPSSCAATKGKPDDGTASYELEHFGLHINSDCTITGSVIEDVERAYTFTITPAGLNINPGLSGSFKVTCDVTCAE